MSDFVPIGLRVDAEYIAKGFRQLEAYLAKWAAFDRWLKAFR